jgi:outer membrane protein TolC
MRLRPIILALLLPVAVATAQTNTAPVVQSLALEQAYDRALATDQTIRIAYAEIQKANLLPWSALTRQGPRVLGNASYAKPEHEIASASLVTTKRADLTVELPLIDFTVFPAFRAGKLSAQAARLAHQFTVRNVLFGVTTAYYDVLKQQRVVEVNRQTLELARGQFDLAQKRFNVGDVTKTDVLRARVTVERAQRTLTESENALRLAHSVLASILNLGTERALVLTDPPAYPVSVESLEALQQRAAAGREDLRVATLAVETAKARRGEVIARYGPRLVAQWNNVWIDPATTSQPNDFWQATVALQIPFFEGGQRELDLRRAGLERTQAELSYENLTKSIAVDVKEAWLRVHSLEQTLQALHAEVEAADENYRSLENQYRAGTATSLEVLDALRDLNTSRTDLAVETYGYQLALRDLERVTGVFQQPRVEKVKQP